MVQKKKLYRENSKALINFKHFCSIFIEKVDTE